MRNYTAKEKVMQKRKRDKLIASMAIVALGMMAGSAMARLSPCRNYIGTGGYYAVYNSDGVAIGSGFSPAGYYSGYMACP